MNKITKNILYQSSYQILILITPLITSPYISRVLGAESLGIYSYTYSIVNYFAILIMLGTNNYGNRSIAMVRQNKTQLSKTFWEIYFLQLIAALISIAGYLLYLILIKPHNMLISILQGIYLLSCALDINWFFFGMEEVKLTVIRNTFVKIISIISVFIFVKSSDDLAIYIFIMTGSMFISQMFLFSFLKRFVKFIKPTLSGIKQHIRPNLILFLPAIAWCIHHTLDKTMLGMLSDYRNSGYYYNVEKLISIPNGLITGIGLVMLPRVSNLIAKGKKEIGFEYLLKSINFMMFVSIAMMFGLIAISHEFVPLFFGNDFTDTIPLVAIMSVVLIIRTISEIIKSQYLIPNEKDRIYVIAMIASAITNFSLNLILIRHMGVFGAGIATVIAELVLCIVQICYANKEVSILRQLWIISPFFFSGLVMYVSIRKIAYLTFSFGTITQLLLEIICGAIIYILLSGAYLLKLEKGLFLHFRNILRLKLTG